MIETYINEFDVIQAIEYRLRCENDVTPTLPPMLRILVTEIARAINYRIESFNRTGDV